MNSRRGKSGD